ncbi:MAG: HAAS signaling domain-containing protein [Acholeplasmataceae bacterium]
MKDKYLEHLEERLKEGSVSAAEIADIIADYDQLYDEAASRGMSDEKIVDFLGNPDRVAQEIIRELRIRHDRTFKYRIIAVMPFLSLTVFILLGTIFDLWHPGWLVFLAIPMTALLIGGPKGIHGLVALSPFLAVIVFIIFGYFDLWHPGWLVFLIIPVSSLLTVRSTRTVLVGLTPFMALVAFILLGIYDLWNPGWLVFLAIPMVSILFRKNRLHVLIYESLFLIAIGLYLYMGLAHGRYDQGAFAFILPAAYGILIGDVSIRFDFSGPDPRKNAIMSASVALLVVAYIATGLLFAAWAYAWQLFLLIPILGIILYDRFRLVAISPFIATILFFSLGYFFDAFAVSWLAFLLIPISAILTES